MQQQQFRHAVAFGTGVGAHTVCSVDGNRNGLILLALPFDLGSAAHLLEGE